MAQLSYGGLALANSISTALEMLVLLILLGRKVRSYNQEAGQTTTVQGLPVRQLLTSGGRSLLASAVMTGAVLVWAGGSA